LCDGLNKIIFRFVAKLLAKFLDTHTHTHTHTRTHTHTNKQTNKQTKPFFPCGNYLIYFWYSNFKSSYKVYYLFLSLNLLFMK